MNALLQSPIQRILEWRNFRNSLAQYDEMQQLSKICQFWGQAPLTSYALDWDQSENWPNAWQLIHEGNFDSIVIGILMEQTLILIGWKPSRVKLIYLRDKKLEDQMMIVLVDDTWALNYSYKEVFEYSRIVNDCVTFVKYQIVNDCRVKI